LHARAPDTSAKALRWAFEQIRPRLDGVEEFINAQLGMAPEPVSDAGSYVFQGGGKRFRPAMLLLVARLLGYRGDRDVRFGAVIEMIHTATLVHDDIIDHANLRRGRPTANHRWGNQLTVLLGDWLYSRSMEIALEVGEVEVIRVLSHATTQMIEGEMLGLRVLGRSDVDEDTYLDIVRRKTAEVFAAATVIPTLFDPAYSVYREPLATYGRSLGVCFQIADDLLDVTATESRLGKPVLSDLREGKLTLPFIRLWPYLSADERDAIEAMLGGRDPGAGAADGFRALLARHGILESVRGTANAYAAHAQEAIALLPPGRERDALSEAPRYVIDREF
jgi:octaprenyl-diphosphate synthase